MPPPAVPLAAEGRTLTLALSASARKALRQPDPLRRLVRWTRQFAVQRLAMWLLWSPLDPRRTGERPEPAPGDAQPALVEN